MRLVIVTPAPAGTQLGNRITALRWAELLREQGQRVRVVERWRGEACDLLIVLHARKSHASLAAFARAQPGRARVLVLTGTDLYLDLPRSRSARSSLALADVLVLLQRESLRRLDRAARTKARVILQSAQGRLRRPRPKARAAFVALVLAHLRPVKDPLRAARAARLVPPGSRLLVRHAGSAHSAADAARAEREMRANPRYRWLGGVAHARALRELERCDVFVLASRAEGGSAALAEALVRGVPVLASRIDANLGMLGARHPGLFEVGDTRALARLLRRCEREPRFLARLARASRELAPRHRRERELAALRGLLEGAVRRARGRAARKREPPRSP